MSKFIEIVATSSTGHTVRHTVNTAHIVELIDHSAYAAYVVLVNDGSIEIDRAQAATVRATLLSDAAINVEATRPNYCDRPDHDRPAYIAAQQQMFAAARWRRLDTEARDSMLAALSAFLGAPLSSRKQLTPTEMIRVTDAIHRGDLIWDADTLQRAA